MIITCSQCGAVKGEVNHWYFAWLERGAQRLCIVPWSFDPELVHEATVSKICGDQCAHKYAQKYFDFLKVMVA